MERHVIALPVGHAGGRPEREWHYPRLNEAGRVKWPAINVTRSAMGGIGAIENTHPKAGEQKSYYNQGPGKEMSDSYGLLAFEPNLGHRGNVLIIAGLGTEGTLAAGELATSADPFKQVASLLGVRDNLPYFEILLKAERVGSSVHAFKIVAWRRS